MNSLHLKVRCSDVACMLIHSDAKISALVHIIRSIQLLMKRLIHNQRHPLELVGLNVAVKKPEPRIIRHEVDHDIPSRWYHYCVLSNRLPIDAEIWLVVPDWLRAESWITALKYCTRHVFTSNIGVKSQKEASVWIIIGISYVNDVECMSMHMYGVRYRCQTPI